MKKKFDLTKIEYDGGRIKLIVEDEAKLIEWLKQQQAEILKDLEERDNEI